MSVTLADLANHFECHIKGDHNKVIKAVSALNIAGPTDIAYLSDKALLKYLKTTKVGALIISKDLANYFSGNALIVDNPRLVFAKVATFLQPVNAIHSGVDPSAVIAKGIKIPEFVFIGQNVVVEEDVVINENVHVDANCYIGRDSVLGEHTKIYSGVNIYPGTKIGRHCIIHSGAVIGSDGFGYVEDQGEWVKVPQLGNVIICNNVEIGANTTIDRGSLTDTVIGDGVKLDNQIQIAHNVHIGDNTAIAACVGIAGSTQIGKHCTIGGQSTILGHLRITDNTHITAASLVCESITETGKYSSSLPVQESKKWNRNLVRLHKLDELIKQLFKGNR